MVPGGGRDQAVRWGSEGPKNYSGELAIDGDETTSTATIRLTTQTSGGEIDESLAESLGNICRLVEAGDAPGACRPLGRSMTGRRLGDAAGRCPPSSVSLARN